MSYMQLNLKIFIYVYDLVVFSGRCSKSYKTFTQVNIKAKQTWYNNLQSYVHLLFYLHCVSYYDITLLVF